MWRWIVVLAPLLVLPLIAFAVGHFFAERSAWQYAVVALMIVTAAHVAWDIHKRFGQG
jgi:hypothetical protein